MVILPIAQRLTDIVDDLIAGDVVEVVVDCGRDLPVISAGRHGDGTKNRRCAVGKEVRRLGRVR